MSQRNYCYLYLTCEDHAEASKITDLLLEERLIICAKIMPIDCAYWWKGKIEKGKEVLVIMESAEDLFEQVEAEITKLHSYDPFVLEALPVAKISKAAQKWMDEYLQP